MAKAGLAVMAWPSQVTVPPAGGTRPAMAFSVVVLPAPFEPSKATMESAGTRQRNIGDTHQIAVANQRLETRQHARWSHPHPLHMVAQIGGDHGGVVDHRPRCALGDDLALMEHHGPLGEGQDHLHDVLDDDDGDA